MTYPQTTPRKHRLALILPLRAVENRLVFSKGPTGSITKRYCYFPIDIVMLIHQRKLHNNRHLIKKVIKVLKLEKLTIIYIGK